VIRVPRETVNDDVVTVARWFVGDGEPVRAGQPVVDIETSKAVLEVVAEADGYLQILHPEGAEVPVGEVVGRVLSEPSQERASARPPAAAISPADSLAADAGTTISKKARRLIEEHAIDPSVFAGRGLVRESDVIKHLEERVARERADAAPDEAAPPAPSPRPQAAAIPSSRERGLWGDAAESARGRGWSPARLVWNYLWRNWLLGHIVRVAPRGVINRVHRMRGVTMGRDCFVDPSAILETAYPENVTLGNDVRVTAGAVIMTHIKAPHYLRDTGIVPAVLEPVVLEDYSFIGVNAVIMPGVTVGQASVVASGAVVVANVPPYTMVAGNPAKVIKRFPRPDARS
jgi:acetyltransferase-like isoleucine patch superfamily enzyme